MDADDVSLPERLEKQVNYLESHPEVGVLSTSGRQIDGHGVTTRISHVPRVPMGPKLIKWSLLFGCCLAHSSVMMRFAVIEQVGGYNNEMIVAQDYDLWVRVNFETQFQIAKLHEDLHLLRRGIPSMVTRRHQILDQEAIRIMQRAISTMLGEEVPMEVIAGFRYMNREHPIVSQHVRQRRKLIKNLYQVYVKTVSPVEAKAIAKDAANRLLSLAIVSRNSSLSQALAAFFEAVILSPSVFPRRIYRKVRRKLESS
jgi:hypothetical protein